MTSILPPGYFRPRQMTPEEQRLRQAEQQFQSGLQQPASYGQGIENFLTGVALGQRRRQYNEGRPPHEQQSNSVRQVAEALMGQKAPWQFPGAPQPGGGNAPAPQFSLGGVLSGIFGKKPTGGGLY